MATKNIKALGNAQSIGWTDALISRLAANSFGLGGRLSITAPANASALSTTGYSLTGSNASSMVDLAGTWNTTGTPTLIKANVTDTASNAASLLLDLQVGGVSRFSVSKIGSVIVRGTAPSALEFAGEGIYAMNTAATQRKAMLSEYGIRAAADVAIGFTNSTTNVGTQDVFLYRDAANTLALRNAANAQAFNIYGTYTDASNYRRVALAMTTAGVATLRPQGAGTGASGNVLHISGLPTSNPGPGILWNNAGAPAIGT